VASRIGGTAQVTGSACGGGGSRNAVRSLIAPAANSAATAVADADADADAARLMAARPLAATAIPVRGAGAGSGPTTTIRSACCAASAMACAKSTGRVSCSMSSFAISPVAVTGRPVTVEMSCRRGAVNGVAARTVRNGAAHLTRAGECSPPTLASMSARMPISSAWRARLRMALVVPVRTCEPGAS
jgi:hypothetical protein